MLTEVQSISTYLGPARVAATAGQRILLEFPDQQAWALLALAYPYAPIVGDVVLAIGQDDQWYVIGILKGDGKTSFTAPGDLELCAPRGSVQILAGKEVLMRGSRVSLAARVLELSAATVSERFGQVRRRVKGAYHLIAQKLRLRLDDSFDLKADRIVQRADRDVRIDGEKIHLG